MKQVRVSCGIVFHEGLVLAVQRSETMDLPLKWEFPGGKLEAGENPEDCLKRELKEELNIEVEIIRPLERSVYRYPQRQIVLLPFICELINPEELHLKEHIAIEWLKPLDLLRLDWCPADIPVARQVPHYLPAGA